MSGTSVELILPECSRDALSEMLRALTMQLERHMENPSGRGGWLGGDYGYGENFENETFALHRYCWCEAVDCPWCAGCECEGGHDGTCSWCRNVHRWADKGALPPNDWPHYGAPHFWHKASGARIWWYKYIGRDMQTLAPALPMTWLTVFDDCLCSIGGPTAQEALREYLAA